ncbi:MAG TPA: electron transfer flavoprotein subunit alpha/FixB family protein [Myxococcota bacterium]|nr:electron transfer flavoprotein subunit alpha/FixB family protein [Myxococcota bacterium]
MSILVLCEHEGGVFKKTASELLGKARELAGVLGGDVAALVLGDAPAASLGQFGAARVFQVGGDFSAYDTDAVVSALHAGVQAASPKYLLAPASFLGKDALPRLAARLGTGQASECTSLAAVGGELVGRRPVYAGKALADVKVTRFPAIYSVRPNSFPQPAASGGDAAVTAVAWTAPAARMTIVQRQKPETSAVDLSEADRIVSGGRSLKSKESFDAVVRPLAKALGATVGASRAAVDSGYAHHEEQVGQTGKTVNPTLYVALGISGAIQHLAGMRTSKVIVAVNKDADAPIFEHATYGLVADLFEVAPLLQRAIEALDS